MKNLYGLFLENPIQLDLLEEEFLKYQSRSEKDVLNGIWKSAAIYEKNTVIYCRMDIIRAYSRKPISLLGKILTIQRSYVAEERVFSTIKKNKTEPRASLELSQALYSIMVVKMNSPQGLILCHKMELLESCKLVCWEYNKEHRSH